MRGQVTLFFVVGIVIIFLGGIGIYFATSSQSNDLSDDAFVDTTIKNNVILDTASGQVSELVGYVGLKGGYYGLSGSWLSYEVPNGMSVDIPYLLDNGTLFLEGVSRIESELEFGIDVLNLPDFGNNSNSSLVAADSQVTSGSVDVFVLNDSVLVNIDKTLRSVEGEKVDEVNGLKFKLSMNLGELYYIAEEITLDQYNRGNQFCLNCALRFLNRSSLELETEEIIGQDEVIIVYYLLDTETEMSFAFAHKFSYSQNLGEVRFNSTEKQIAYIGYPFEYAISYSGEKVSFSDDSDLFDIDSSSGVISFTPSEADVGEYFFNIIGSNGYSSDSVLLEFEVKDFGGKPNLLPIGFVQGRVGQSHTFNLNVSNNISSVYFFSNSSFVEVNEVGLVTINSELEFVGDVEFSVMDSFGNTDVEVAHLVIT